MRFGVMTRSRREQVETVTGRRGKVVWTSLPFWSVPERSHGCSWRKHTYKSLILRFSPACCLTTWGTAVAEHSRTFTPSAALLPSKDRVSFCFVLMSSWFARFTGQKARWTPQLYLLVEVTVSSDEYISIHSSRQLTIGSCNATYIHQIICIPLTLCRTVRQTTNMSQNKKVFASVSQPAVICPL